MHDRRPRRGRPAALLLAVGLASLAGGPALSVSVITRTGTTPIYSPNAIMMAKQDGGLPTEVYGGPSGRGGAAAVLAPLRLPATVGGGRFVPARRTQAKGVRMVLVFNDDDLSPREVCGEPSDIRPGRTEGGLDVYAVLCRGSEFISHAHLRDEAVSGPRDPHYPGAMNQLLLALMPPEEMRDEEDLR